MAQLFDTTEFTVEKKENPLKEIAIPDKWLVIYLNSNKTFQISSHDTMEDADRFCKNKYPTSLLACRVVKSKDLFDDATEKLK